MKREIWCPTCSQGYAHTKVRMHPEDVRIGVQVHAVGGKLKTDARCDVCNVLLLKTQLAVAISISDMRSPYSPWEAEYIDSNGGNKK